MNAFLISINTARTVLCGAGAFIASTKTTTIKG